MGIKVKDVANKLNISPSTVSLVLNNKPGISEETRNRVFEAVKEMGFGDLLAERNNVPKTLQFIVYRRKNDISSDSSFFSQVFSQIIEGVEAQSKARGYSLIISYVNELEAEQQLDAIKSNRCEGILLLATEMDSNHLRLLKNLNLPIVILDNYFETEPYDCITINNEQGVYQAISYLAEMGHRNIGYLHSNAIVNNFSERYFAYLRALKKCGLSINQEHIWELNITEINIKQKISLLLKNSSSLPTAFFADNDILAIYTMKTLQEMDYRVPEDISFVGFDNISLTEVFDPPLTSVYISKQSLGKIAVNRLIDKLTLPFEPSVKIEVTTNLIKRKSVKKL